MTNVFETAVNALHHYRNTATHRRAADDAVTAYAEEAQIDYRAAVRDVTKAVLVRERRERDEAASQAYRDDRETASDWAARYGQDA